MTIRNPHSFPPGYIEAVHRFQEHGRCQLGPMTEKAARSGRSRLYQYKRALWDSRSDPAAEALHDILQRAIITIQDAPDGAKYLVLEPDPVCAAISQPAVESD